MKKSILKILILATVIAVVLPLLLSLMVRNHSIPSEETKPKYLVEKPNIPNGARIVEGKYTLSRLVLPLIPTDKNKIEMNSDLILMLKTLYIKAGLYITPEQAMAVIGANNTSSLQWLIESFDKNKNFHWKYISVSADKIKAIEHIKSGGIIIFCISDKKFSVVATDITENYILMLTSLAESPQWFHISILDNAVYYFISIK